MSRNAYRFIGLAAILAFVDVIALQQYGKLQPVIDKGGGWLGHAPGQQRKVIACGTVELEVTLYAKAHGGKLSSELDHKFRRCAMAELWGEQGRVMAEQLTDDELDGLEHRGKKR